MFTKVFGKPKQEANAVATLDKLNEVWFRSVYSFPCKDLKRFFPITILLQFVIISFILFYYLLTIVKLKLETFIPDKIERKLLLKEIQDCRYITSVYAHTDSQTRTLVVAYRFFRPACVTSLSYEKNGTVETICIFHSKLAFRWSII